MWDQFIAGLTSETLRVKLTGKGQRHRDAAAIPVLVNIAFGKRCNKCGIVGHFARACKGGTRKQAGNKQQSNFVDDDADEEAFVAECKASHLRSFTPCSRREIENCESTNRLSFNLQYHAQQFIKPVIP